MAWEHFVLLGAGDWGLEIGRINREEHEAHKERGNQKSECEIKVLNYPTTGP